MSNNQHIPVLLEEVISLLNPGPSKKFIDATLGGAGHTEVILSHGSKVLGIDQDPEALKIVASRLQNPNLTTVESNFMTIKTQAEKYSFEECDGILFDLGVSSFQLDNPERGFSFSKSAPLDMRMSRRSTTTAGDIVNQASEDELYELLVMNSQEEKAREIARAIVQNRPIESTIALADLVLSVYHNRRGSIHPATKTFQALRIAVNQELKIIVPTLKDAFSILKVGGVIAVISFHEGEDRLVKRSFNDLIESGIAVELTKKPIIPSSVEVLANPRSRSAKLRAIKKV